MKSLCLFFAGLGLLLTVSTAEATMIRDRVSGPGLSLGYATSNNGGDVEADIDFDFESGQYTLDSLFQSVTVEDNGLDWRYTWRARGSITEGRALSDQDRSLNYDFGDVSFRGWQRLWSYKTAPDIGTMINVIDGDFSLEDAIVDDTDLYLTSWDSNWYAYDQYMGSVTLRGELSRKVAPFSMSASYDPKVAPEPGSAALAGAGLLCLVLRRRRRGSA